MNTTLADILETEAKKLTGFVYSSFPFSCGLTEAMIHARRYKAPKKMEVCRDGGITTITIKNGRRKPLVIKLWT